MIEQILWQFLEYRKRKQAVIIGTIITGLVVVWPAADEYMAARERIRNAESELAESQDQVDKLPQFIQMYEKRMNELKKLEKRSVTKKAAQRMRDDVTRLVRAQGCRLSRIVLGGDLHRDWTANDSPVNHTEIVDRGGDTPFRLVTQQMSISLSGSMTNVKNFLAKLHEMERFIHTKQISLVRGSSGKAELDIDIMMFELAQKPST